MEIHDTARRMSHYRWMEERLFEVMGAWATAVPEPAVKRYLATQCHRHSWHASLWQERLPVLSGVAVDEPMPMPDASLITFIEALASPVGPDTTIEKLAGACRVLLPRLVAAYQTHLVSTDQLIDGPTHRVLTLALRDEQEGWQEGELLLQSLIQTAPEAARAAVHQARLEGILVTGAWS